MPMQYDLPMRHVFLNRVAFSAVLELQDLHARQVRSGSAHSIIIGFESEPVVTLGVRASEAEDILVTSLELENRGFDLIRIDRGGRATMHHPGQLVIFPVCRVSRIELRTWINEVTEATARCLQSFGIGTSWRDDAPGLYSSRGKIMSCGFRLQNGVTTHGLSINVSNHLEDFSLIRGCGVENAALDRIGPEVPVEAVFAAWCREFVPGEKRRTQFFGGG